MKKSELVIGTVYRVQDGRYGDKFDARFEGAQERMVKRNDGFGFSTRSVLRVVLVFTVTRTPEYQRSWGGAKEKVVGDELHIEHGRFVLGEADVIAEAERVKLEEEELERARRRKEEQRAKDAAKALQSVLEVPVTAVERRWTGWVLEISVSDAERAALGVGELVRQVEDA